MPVPTREMMHCRPFEPPTRELFCPVTIMATMDGSEYRMRLQSRNYPIRQTNAPRRLANSCHFLAHKTICPKIAFVAFVVFGTFLLASRIAFMHLWVPRQPWIERLESRRARGGSQTGMFQKVFDHEPDLLESKKRGFAGAVFPASTGFAPRLEHRIQDRIQPGVRSHSSVATPIPP